MPVFLGVPAKYQTAEKNRVQNPNLLRAGAMTDSFASVRRPYFTVPSFFSYFVIYSECPFALHSNASKYICTLPMWKLYITASGPHFEFYKQYIVSFPRIGKCVLSPPPPPPGLCPPFDHCLKAKGIRKQSGIQTAQGLRWE